MKKRSFFRLFWLSALICWQCCFVADALEVKSLYKVCIPVRDQQAQTKAALLQAGFETVLFRLSGDKTAIQRPEISQARASIDQYVNRYTFNQTPEGLFFNVDFSKDRFEKLFKKANMPILGKNRPLTILWLLIDTKFSREVVKPLQYPEIVKQIELLADQRAMPVIVPLYDLVDLESVSSEDIWSLTAKPIQKASGRYGANTVLVGKLTQDLETWQGHFMLLGEQSDPLIWQAMQPDLKSLLSNMMDNLSEKIAANYAIQMLPKLSKRNRRQTQLLSVFGISSLEQYARVKDYLSGLVGVRTLAIKEVLPECALFEIETTGNGATLVKTIELDRILIQRSDHSQTGSTLAYKVAS